MKAEAITNSTIEIPKAKIIIELPNGKMVAATGFIIRGDQFGEPIIIIKAPRVCDRLKNNLEAIKRGEYRIVRSSKRKRKLQKRGEYIWW